MKSSESLKTLLPDLFKAKAKITTANKSSDNPYFKSKYADLNAIMDACETALKDNNIMLLQPVNSDERGSFVETVLLHTSGEWISSEMRLEFKENDMQKMGSAVSYARRYSLQSLLGMRVVDGEDDDGNKASGAKPSNGKSKNGFKPPKSSSTKTTASEDDGWN